MTFTNAKMPITMSDPNPEFVERYQILLERDPKSKVFAPLAEAYRKLGLLKEALQICVQGVQYHPDFSGGRIALARVLIDQGDIRTACEHLQKAAEMESENILAQMLLGDYLIKLKNPKEALKAYKMVLFINPNNERAAKTVKKLESLTADEYDDELFEIESFGTLAEDADPALPLSPTDRLPKLKNIDRYVSLADAFLIRNDLDRAQQVLVEAQEDLGPHPEILRRIKLLSLRTSESSGPKIMMPTPSIEAPPLNRYEALRSRKIQMLQRMLNIVRKNKSAER